MPSMNMLINMAIYNTVAFTRIGMATIAMNNDSLFRE